MNMCSEKRHKNNLTFVYAQQLMEYLMVDNPENKPAQTHNVRWLRHEELMTDEDYKPTVLQTQGWESDVLKVVDKIDIRVYDDQYYTDLILPCVTNDKQKGDTHNLIIVCDYKEKGITVVMFDEWDVTPYSANIAKVGNIIKNIGLEAGLKCDG